MRGGMQSSHRIAAGRASFYCCAQCGDKAHACTGKATRFGRARRAAGISACPSCAFRRVVSGWDSLLAPFSSAASFSNCRRCLKLLARSSYAQRPAVTMHALQSLQPEHGGCPSKDQSLFPHSNSMHMRFAGVITFGSTSTC